MSINEIREKGKSKLSLIIAYEKELFVALLIILVAMLAFGLGRLSRLESNREPVKIENAQAV